MNEIVRPVWIASPLPPAPSAPASATAPLVAEPTRGRSTGRALALVVLLGAATVLGVASIAWTDAPPTARIGIATAAPPLAPAPAPRIERGSLGDARPAASAERPRLAAAPATRALAATARPADEPARPTTAAAPKPRATPTPGRLRLEHPGGGMVLVDGEWLDARAPATVRLSSGWHVVAVRSNDGRLSPSRRVKIEAGQTAVLRF